ncbi:MAG: O-antigen ligase family protein [Clostridia bacterium]|nr:O-antigen ligase family protein [Clostridia bacterium]
MGKLKIKKSSIEKLAVILVLIRSTSALIPLLREEAAINPSVFHWFNAVISMGLSLVVLCLCLTKIKTCFRALLKDKWQCVLMVFVLTTVFWSQDPLLTVKQFIILLGTTLFGVYLAVRFTQKEFLKLLYCAVTVCAFFSLVFVFLIPSLGMHGQEYQEAWRGIYLHKNTLGRLMVLGVVCTLILMGESRKKHSPSLWIWLVVFLSMVFFAKSKTAVVLLFILLLILPVFKLLHLHIFVAVPGVILAVLSLSLLLSKLVMNIDSVLLFIGGDITLTGRTVLWEAVWEKIQERFWLGYGYAAFWLGKNGPSRQVWEAVYWAPPDAHNGFLDLWLQTGLIGVIIFSLSLLTNLVRATVLAREHPKAFNRLPLIYLIFFIFINTSESTILVRSSIYWILYVAFSIFLNYSRRKKEQGPIEEFKTAE